MNWNCLFWAICALLSGILSVLVYNEILDPLTNTEITTGIMLLLMIVAVVYAGEAAKEDDEDEDQNEYTK